MKRNILGPRIRERRRDIGITQAALAKRLDISASYLNLIEHNKRDISGSLLRRVADELEIDLALLDGAADRGALAVSGRDLWLLLSSGPGSARVQRMLLGEGPPEPALSDLSDE